MIVPIALLLAGSQPMSSPFDDPPLKSVQLTPLTRGYEPGKLLTLAVKITLKSGWHTYWINPGDSGMPPKLNWTLPTGWRVKSVVWPAPHRITADGIVSFGYEDEVLAKAELMTSTNPLEEAKIGLELSALVCQQQCLPASTSAVVTISATESPQVDGEEVKALEAVHYPQPLKSSTPINVQWGKEALLSFSYENSSATQFEFYPSAAGVLNHEKTVTKTTHSGTQWGLHLAISSYLDSKPKRLTGVLVPLDDKGKRMDVSFLIDAPIK
ncbi:MAG: hypothetical protein JST40_04555 [Armatimonadetes bacterium]|nr:hypothetical protein [Armatimonadota bacterium]